MCPTSSATLVLGVKGVMIYPAILNWLTARFVKAMLYLLSQKTKVGISSPGTTGQKAAFNAVFYCPAKIQAELIRLISIMADCLGGLFYPPVPVAGTGNPIQSATHEFPVMSGGLILTTGDRYA